MPLISQHPQKKWSQDAERIRWRCGRSARPQPRPRTSAAGRLGSLPQCHCQALPKRTEQTLRSSPQLPHSAEAPLRPLALPNPTAASGNAWACRGRRRNVLARTGEDLPACGHRNWLGRPACGLVLAETNWFLPVPWLDRQKFLVMSFGSRCSEKGKGRKGVFRIFI